MKKDRTALGYSGKKCTVFLLIAALLCVYLPLTAAAAPDAALVKIVETVFEDGEGQEIYEFQPGVVRAVTYMTAEQAGTVRYAAAVYGANKMLKEISYSSAEVLKGANVLRSDYITAGSGDEVRLLLWDGDLRPAERASVLGEAGAKAVSSATVTVNGSMYQGNVNRVKRTVTVDIPVGISADESAVQTAQSWLKSAQVRLSGQWSAIAPAAQGNYDLSAPMRFTLSDAQGETAEYTLTARIVRYSRAYDVTGAAIQGEDSSQWNNKYRVGAPAYIISEANKGNGVWFLSGATVEGANANAVSIKQENGNDYINISKQPGSFELWSSGTVENTREFATEFRFRINSQEGGTSAGDFMQVWSGNVDDVVFSRRGDCFVVGHRNNNDSGIAYVPGVQLGFGEWHTLRYVFKKAAQPAPDMEYDAYSMELYLDGKMIDEYCHGVAAANAQYAGRLSYANVTGASFPYIAFNPFSAVTIDMDIDDVLCTHVPLSSDVSVTDAEVSIGGKVYQADVCLLYTSDAADEL